MKKVVLKLLGLFSIVFCIAWALIVLLHLLNYYIPDLKIFSNEFLRNFNILYMTIFFDPLKNLYDFAIVQNFATLFMDLIFIVLFLLVAFCTSNIIAFAKDDDKVKQKSVLYADVFGFLFFVLFIVQYLTNLTNLLSFMLYFCIICSVIWLLNFVISFIFVFGDKFVKKK